MMVLRGCRFGVLFSAVAIAGVVLVQVESPSARAEEGAKERLPNNWSKLDLTKEQREKVLAARAKISEREEALQAELEKLRAATKEKARELRDLNKTVEKELMAILTDTQKKKLLEFEEKAAEKAAAREAKKLREIREKLTGKKA